MGAGQSSNAAANAPVVNNAAARPWYNLAGKASNALTKKKVENVVAPMPPANPNYVNKSPPSNTNSSNASSPPPEMEGGRRSKRKSMKRNTKKKGKKSNKRR